MRIHTDRIDPGDPQYLQIMAQHPGPIREAGFRVETLDSMCLSPISTSSFHIFFHLFSLFLVEFHGFPMDCHRFSWSFYVAQWISRTSFDSTLRPHGRSSW